MSTGAAEASGTSTTVFGEVFDPADDRWEFRTDASGRGGTVTLWLDRLTAPTSRSRGDRSRHLSVFHESLAAEMRTFLAALASRVKPRTLVGELSALVHFERTLASGAMGLRTAHSVAAPDLTFVLIDAYRDVCMQSATGIRGSYASSVRRFYAWAVGQNLPGYSHSVLAQLKRMRCAVRIVGRATRFSDPNRAAFNWEEQEQIDAAWRARLGNIGDCIAARVCRETGLRPTAAALLQVKHLATVRSRSGDVSFVLNIPRTKQSSLSDGSTYAFPVSADLGHELIKCHTACTDNEAPLLQLWSDRVASHRIDVVLKRWSADAKLVANRGGQCRPLTVFAYRFRRTLATNLADQGATAEEIAAALDDNTLTMATVYVDHSSSIVNLLSTTLDRHPEWLTMLSMFCGRVVQRAPKLPRVLCGAPHLAQYDEYASGESIGWCASTQRCEREPPLDCYTCPFFRAAHALQPHQRQLSQLYAEINSGLGRESDRMAATLVRVAAAIAQVIALIAPSRGTVGDVLEAVRLSRRSIFRPELPS